MSRRFPHITSFLDKSFQEQHSRNYVLSALIDAHNIAFCIYEPLKNKVIGLVNCSPEDAEKEIETSDLIENLLNTVPYLGFPFARVCMVYYNNLSTLVPTPLFNQNNAALYLEFNHEFTKETRVLFDAVKHTDAVNVYGFSEKFVKRVKIAWPNVCLRHAASSMIENLHILVKNKNDNNILFVNVAKNSFDLIYFKEGKLHFYNQFAYNTKEDLIYFLLASIEQLELNPESVSLQLLGSIEKGGEIYEILYRYIRNIDFVHRNDNFSYSYVLDDLKPHEHFLLFNNLQCE